jgi:hypothetical protein
VGGAFALSYRPSAVVWVCSLDLGRVDRTPFGFGCSSEASGTEIPTSIGVLSCPVLCRLTERKVFRLPPTDVLALLDVLPQFFAARPAVLRAMLARRLLSVGADLDAGAWRLFASRHSHSQHASRSAHPLQSVARKLPMSTLHSRCHAVPRRATPC